MPVTTRKQCLDEGASVIARDINEGALIAWKQTLEKSDAFL